MKAVAEVAVVVAFRQLTELNWVAGLFKKKNFLRPRPFREIDCRRLS